MSRPLDATDNLKGHWPGWITHFEGAIDIEADQVALDARRTSTLSHGIQSLSLPLGTCGLFAMAKRRERFDAVRPSVDLQVLHRELLPTRWRRRDLDETVGVSSLSQDDDDGPLVDFDG
jgi:hypothetical protein